MLCIRKKATRGQKKRADASILWLAGVNAYIYVLILIVFALCTALFNIYLTIAELGAAVILLIYARTSGASRQKSMMKYVEKISGCLDTATRDTMLNSPLPMVVLKPHNAEVIWSNERFLQISGEREHLFDTRITTTVPGFDTRWLLEGKTEYPKEVTLKDRKYMVFGNLVYTQPTAGAKEQLATTYWVDITALSGLRERYYTSRPIVAILLRDNYEEMLSNLSDNAKSSIVAALDEKMESWAAPAKGLLCKYDRDRYLFVFEERYLQEFVKGKFSILDMTRQVVSPAGIPATVSIGIGRDGESFQELFQYALLSIEMALSRGGDQVVIKNRFNFEFYGGRAKEPERRTKVKSRVMANALAELIVDASRVFVMGHKLPDLDSLGAAVGVCAIARKRGNEASIVFDRNNNLVPIMSKRLLALPEYANAFITPQDALAMVDRRSLLIVVDTNRPEQVESQELLQACGQIVVIDHHRRAATYIANAALNIHEPYASSASELVTELLQYLMEPADLLRTEAEALLAGIVLDTKNFTMRTGSRTFDAAAFLRRSGAETGEVRKLFQSDLDSAIARYDIIRNARMYRDNIAIAALDHAVGRVTAAQAADELLNISGIDVSFVLYPEQDKVIVSARSMGDLNVQMILEKLGGGGNATVSGAQLHTMGPDAALQALLRAIDQYLEEK